MLSLVDLSGRKRALAVARFPGRFWSKVQSGSAEECWPWTGRLMRNGYGVIDRAGALTTNGRRRPVLAHRTALELSGVAVPGDLCVCHRCDNPRCCNPAHLFLGTAKDNIDDMNHKGRGSAPPVRVGSANNKAKLSAEQVVAIREEYARGGISMRKLAAKYSVTFAPIQLILSGKTWRHV